MDSRLSPKNDLDVSVIIVCFNDRDVLLPCLESIYQGQDGARFEVILVDNGSRDGSVEAVRERFRDVRIVAPGYNAGYTGGNNYGFERADGRYVLFLNPDTILHPGALGGMVARADRLPRAGAVGPHVVNPDGSLQRSCFRSPTVADFVSVALFLHRLPGYSELVGVLGYRDDEYEREHPVHVVSGCCLLARRELLARIGAFDDAYFIYFEETDLCERIRQSGRDVVYTPAATIKHLGGATTVKQDTWFRIQFEKSRRRFFSKFRPASAGMMLDAILVFHCLLRVVLGGIGVILCLGRARALRAKTAAAARILAWRLGWIEQGPRPS